MRPAQANFFWGGFTPSTQYQAVLTRATAIGATKPSLAQQILDDTLMRALVSSGILAQLDAFYWHANDGDRAYAKINWVSPGTYDQTESGTVTWTSKIGFNGDGVSGVLKWNFAATNGVQYQRNNSSFGAYINQGNASSGVEALIGAFGQAFLAEVSGPLFGRIQNSTGNSFGTGTDFTAGKTYAVVRTGASATANYISGVSVATGTDASAANDSHAFFTFGNNIQPEFGFVQYPLSANVQVGGTWAGSGAINQATMHTLLYNRMMGNIILGTHFASYTQNKITLSGQTGIHAYGDSITVGTGASVLANAYISLLGTAKGLTVFNFGGSGRGCWYAASQQGVVPSSVHVLTSLTGLNDVRRGGSGAKTLKKIEAGHRVLAVRAIKDNATLAASGSASVTRSGTIAGFAASTVGGLYGSGVLPGSFASSSSTIGDNWQWAFTGTGFAVQFIANSGDTETYGSVDIYIDGSVVKTVDLNIWYDNISDGTYDNRRGPLAFSFHGLSNASHTVKVQVKTTGICPVDFFCQIKDPAGSAKVIFGEISYASPPGYAGAPSSGSIAASDSASDVIRTVVDEYIALGYSFSFAKTNTKYNVYDGITSDNIHPSDIGHSEIYTAFTNAIN